VSSRPKRRVVVVHDPPSERAVRGVLAGHDAEDEVVVVAPALLGRLRYWASDDAEARDAAGSRVDAWIAALRLRHVRVAGHVGDSAPLQAIADEVVLADPCEVVIVTPSAEGNWQTRNLVERARRRFAVPIAELRTEQSQSRELSLSGFSQVVLR
jgi:hypothetical protein